MRLANEAGAIDIALGIPQLGPPVSAVTAATAALSSGLHQYAPPAGLPGLRRMIANQFSSSGRGWDVDPGTEVTITCGATEAIMIALLSTTDPGDEVILLEPYFEVYPGMVELAGAIPVPVPLTQPDWRLDMAAVASRITSRTRAILLNTPNNPTGSVLNRGEIRDLTNMCVEHGLACISDEVYERFVFDADHVSPASVPECRERTIVAGSLSKSLRMTGWRLGYCVAEPGLTTVLRRVHERTTVGTSHPLQSGAAAVLPEDFCTAEMLRERRDAVSARLSGMGFDVQTPEGGWFVLAGVGPHSASSSQLARRLVTEAGVLVAPGTAFFSDRAEGERWIRVTFARDPDATDKALELLADFVAGQDR
ncbi:pyridoxal phosphate-dependent aminotransferase [Amycolatopsis antarctica]|nr:pyridoxal phosphate-dependent aminotransferase [Amycolatopsis antarctica]